MNKKIFIGFDNTLVNTNKAIVEVYNSIYSESVDVDTIKQFNLMDGCVYLGENYNGDVQADLKKILSSKEFWSMLQLHNGAAEILNKLKAEGYQLVLYTSQQNLELELFKDFIGQHLSMFDEVLELKQNNNNSEENMINMESCFNVNNAVSALQNSNAQTKIVVGKELKGNRNPGYFRILDWNDAYKYITQVHEANQM